EDRGRGGQRPGLARNFAGKTNPRDFSSSADAPHPLVNTIDGSGRFIPPIGPEPTKLSTRAPITPRPGASSAWEVTDGRRSHEGWRGRDRTCPRWSRDTRRL